MSCRTLKGFGLAGILGITLVLAAVPAVEIAFAEAPSGTTNITLTVTKSVRFGEDVGLSARLVDATGAAISGAKVAFVAPDTYFLGTTSDVLIAEVQTSKDGVAEARYQARDGGWLAVRAEFRGNDRYAAARATARVLVDEPPRQLYVEHAGVQVPGLNAPPSLRSTNLQMDVGTTSTPPSGLAGLWPRISAWPIALVLLIVWSLYAVAVRQMFRIASAGRGDVPPVHYGRGRSNWISAGGAQGSLEQGGVPRPRNGEDR